MSNVGNGRQLVANMRWFIDNWWLTLLRGIAAIAFGVLTFVSPVVAVLSLTLLWGAFALVDGGLAFGNALFGHGAPVAGRWWLALAGLAGIVAGILTLRNPEVTTIGLLVAFSVWLIINGVMQIIGAIQLRKVIDNEWLLALSGILSILLGFVLVAQPAAGLISVAWMIGIYAIAGGVFYVLLSFRLRDLASRR